VLVWQDTADEALDSLVPHPTKIAVNLRSDFCARVLIHVFACCLLVCAGARCMGAEAIDPLSSACIYTSERSEDAMNVNMQ
jgi:hypothetical protein